jgi:hypothetical protein
LAAVATQLGLPVRIDDRDPSAAAIRAMPAKIAHQPVNWPIAPCDIAVHPVIAANAPSPMTWIVRK